MRENIKNIGISISKHLVTLLIFSMKNDVLPRRLSTYVELFLSWLGLYLSAVT